MFTPCSKQTMAYHMNLTHLPLVVIDSGNVLSPVWRQAITCTNAGLLPFELLGTNLSEIWIWILPVSLKKNCLKMSSAKMVAILSRGRWVNDADPTGFHFDEGGRFNIKTLSYRYRDFHYKEEMVSWLSYLYNRYFFTGKMTSIYCWPRWVHLL